MRYALLLLALAFVAACGSEPDPADRADRSGSADVDFSDEAPPGAEQIVITTRDGDVDMGLTDEVLFVRLTEERRAQIEGELAAEAEANDGLGGFIAETVGGALSGLLANAIQIPVEDVEDVRYEDGRLDVVLRGQDDFPTVENDGQDVTEAFAPDDAQRFAETFDRLKSDW